MTQKRAITSPTIINPCCFQDSSPLEVQLAPTGRELVRALRELLLQAHWHTFTLLADSSSATILQRPELWGPLSTMPLHPSLVPLAMPLRPRTLFRYLQVSAGNRDKRTDEAVRMARLGSHRKCVLAKQINEKVENI